MAVCVAVIAKENYPLYIRSSPTENELKFHYMVHTSLDVVDEKISAMGKALVDQRELYLGLLYPTEDHKVYGYVTNSKVKFVMVVDSSNTALRDNEIRSVSVGGSAGRDPQCECGGLPDSEIHSVSGGSAGRAWAGTPSLSHFVFKC
ncbi:trafficking protein particle complex subunit 2-like protein isoform X1 [Mustela erminea]|uniref:trafficking protein particle complex subunit 2-like protein isoform X1 n=1 Tax=Mustela erminea TaxID=36723 RepID=UPI0013866551|nr:trafficking protein particle complex subunit 2-like protein isoform X1 [Mustela erminea]